MISGCWQFDLWFLCLSKTSLNIREFTVLVKDKAFPVVIYGYESWTIKKVEHQRIDAFELWCWRRLLRVPWIARRSNQSILKEIVLGVLWKESDAKAETPILWPPHAKS